MTKTRQAVICRCLELSIRGSAMIFAISSLLLISGIAVLSVVIALAQDIADFGD